MSVLRGLCGLFCTGVMECFVLLTGWNPDDNPYGDVLPHDVVLPCDEKYATTDREKLEGKYMSAHRVMPVVCCCVELFYVFGWFCVFVFPFALGCFSLSNCSAT